MDSKRMDEMLQRMQAALARMNGVPGPIASASSSPVALNSSPASSIAASVAPSPVPAPASTTSVVVASSASAWVAPMAAPPAAAVATTAPSTGASISVAPASSTELASPNISTRGKFTDDSLGASRPRRAPPRQPRPRRPRRAPLRRPRSRRPRRGRLRVPRLRRPRQAPLRPPRPRRPWRRVYRPARPPAPLQDVTSVIAINSPRPTEDTHTMLSAPWWPAYASVDAQMVFDAMRQRYITSLVPAYLVDVVLLGSVIEVSEDMTSQSTIASSTWVAAPIVPIVQMVQVVPVSRSLGLRLLATTDPVQTGTTHLFDTAWFLLWPSVCSPSPTEFQRTIPGHPMLILVASGSFLKFPSSYMRPRALDTIQSWNSLWPPFSFGWFVILLRQPWPPPILVEMLLGSAASEMFDRGKSIMDRFLLSIVLSVGHFNSAANELVQLQLPWPSSCWQTINHARGVLSAACKWDCQWLMASFIQWSFRPCHWEITWFLPLLMCWSAAAMVEVQVITRDLSGTTRRISMQVSAALNVVSNHQVLVKEKAILAMIYWTLIDPTMYMFIVQCLAVVKDDTEIECMAFFCSEIALVHYTMLICPLSVTAVAAVCVARCTISSMKLRISYGDHRVFDRGKCISSALFLSTMGTVSHGQIGIPAKPPWLHCNNSDGLTVCRTCCSDSIFPCAWAKCLRLNCLGLRYAVSLFKLADKKIKGDLCAQVMISDCLLPNGLSCLVEDVLQVTKKICIAAWEFSTSPLRNVPELHLDMNIMSYPSSADHVILGYYMEQRMLDMENWRSALEGFKLHRLCDIWLGWWSASVHENLVMMFLIAAIIQLQHFQRLARITVWTLWLLFNCSTSVLWRVCIHDHDWQYANLWKESAKNFPLGAYFWRGCLTFFSDSILLVACSEPSGDPFKSIMIGYSNTNSQVKYSDIWTSTVENQHVLWSRHWRYDSTHAMAMIGIQRFQFLSLQQLKRLSIKNTPWDPGDYDSGLRASHISSGGECHGPGYHVSPMGRETKAVVFSIQKEQGMEHKGIDQQKPEPRLRPLLPPLELLRLVSLLFLLLPSNSMLILV